MINDGGNRNAHYPGLTNVHCFHVLTYPNEPCSKTTKNAKDYGQSMRLYFTKTDAT